MKQFLIWAIILIALYAGYTALNQLYEAAHPKQILVAIDVSLSLEPVKSKLPQALAFLQEIPYARFKIVTNSPNRDLKVIQDWDSQLNLDKVIKIPMYTTFSLEEFLNLPELKTADRVIIVTNSPSTAVFNKLAHVEVINIK